MTRPTREAHGAHETREADETCEAHGTREADGAGRAGEPPLLTLRVSRDGGRTWSAPTILRDREKLTPAYSPAWPPCACPCCRTARTRPDHG
ncbi:hypothetical protein [Streptomyces sudanensis]|uniref:hypothetical protein n=1 Tax=Streptomyces sudanensis TaxID=436397 RepID=UPI0020CD5A07|nr:hypothetical protein [Streptomyces sudanensis]MCP9958608.1 hypothetical protein [Streptomyces sudanensis]MCQ0000890.1 hypothetical protein [Streptomyces sudanensis]